ncbi:LysR family transcriptional regulator [Legionella sp. WA2022007384]
MSKLERIAAFIDVVDENGFAAAARKQGVSTAAISRLVTRLESDLNVELLKRTTRKVSLTEIGITYYQHCKKTIDGLREAEIAIAGSQNEAVGTLKVVSSRYFALKHLIPGLSSFMAKNPNLQVMFELAERFPDMDMEEIDILFGVSLEGAGHLVRKRVAMTRYVLCASPEYLKKYGTPRVPHDLSKHHYITHSMRTPDNVLVFKDNKEIVVHPILWLNDSRAMRECAILGMGIVKLHDYIIADALRDGHLIEVLSEFQDQQLPVYVYYQQSRYLQPKIRKFIDFFTTNEHLLDLD